MEGELGRKRYEKCVAGFVGTVVMGSRALAVPAGEVVEGRRMKEVIDVEMKSEMGEMDGNELLDELRVPLDSTEEEKVTPSEEVIGGVLADPA